MANEWAEGLAGMSGDQIKQAIDHCRATMKWSPTIAEFREASMRGETAEQRAQRARLKNADTERLALPSRTWAEQRADGARQALALRQMLAEAETRSAVAKAAMASPDDDLDDRQAVVTEQRKREALDALARLQAGREGVA